MTIVNAPPTLEEPWPVALLSAKIKGWIDRLGSAWIEGEITQWNISGGTVYGRLKDLNEDASVGFTVWSSVRARVPGDLKPGDHVLALVKPNFWVKGGSLTMQVLDMRHVGLGDLMERLERLRQKLKGEGLFDRDRKRALPFLPGRIGLVTARDSDAEKDVLRNAQLRWPSVEFRVVHATVQGDRAVGEVISAIRTLDADPSVDVIIVARGGGDFQNLLVFSDESLLRAASECTTPLVSAIGHEADRPLLDEVADLRASTPTDAAKRVVPDVAEETARIQQVRSRLGMRITALLTQQIDRLEQVRSRPVLASADWIVDSRSDEIGRWVGRAGELLGTRIERALDRTTDLRAHLHALSPARTLDRGYAIAQRADGSILRRAQDAASGESLLLTLSEGRLRTEVVDAAASPGTAR